MATIKDVAAHAGVSIATVSNFINHTKPISKETEAKIKKAIDELQYAQNLSARSLKSNIYTDIGIILPNFNDPYYVQIFQGIETVFQNTPYSLNLAFTYDIPEIERNVARKMLRKQVCGLILVTCCPDDWKFYYENFNRCNRPVILLDRAIHNLDCSLISFDNRQAIRHLTEQLLRRGFSKLFLMAGPQQYTCEADCAAGFQEAHDALGVPLRPDAICFADLNKEHAFRTTASRLRKELPEVILTTSDLMATGVIEALCVLGYSTEQIHVVTLGEEHWNKHTCSLANYATVRPAIRLGTEAAELLIQSLQSPLLQESEHKVLHSGDMAKAPLPVRHAERVRISDQEKLRILMLDTPFVHAFCSLLRNFEVQTGIGTDVRLLPHHNLYDSIIQGFDSGNPDACCDVYMYDMPWVSLLASQGVLADLTDAIADLDPAVFLPGCLERFGGFQGRCYGLPFLYAPQILYYRKDLFDDLALRNGFEKAYGSPMRPPVTFKEFNAMAEYFTRHSNAIPYGLSVAAAYDECLAPEIYTRLLATGGRILDEQGHVVFDSPETLRAYINFVQALSQAKPDYRTATDTTIVEDFLNGETAMLITYPPFMTDVMDLRKSNLIGTIGCSQTPGRNSVLGGWGLGVGSGSQQFDKAAAFLKWTCSQQMSGYFALLGAQGTVTSTYQNDELIKLYPWLPLYQGAYEYARPVLPPVVAGGRVVSHNAIDAIVCRWAYRLMDGQCSVDETIRGTQQELEQSIAKIL